MQIMTKDYLGANHLGCGLKIIHDSSNNATIHNQVDNIMPIKLFGQLKDSMVILVQDIVQRAI